MSNIAYNYHWSKTEILELYPDEAILHNRQIEKRRIDDIIINLQVAHNPHTKEPKKMFENLERLKKSIDGKTEVSERDPNATEKIKAILSKAKQ